MHYSASSVRIAYSHSPSGETCYFAIETSRFGTGTGYFTSYFANDLGKRAPNTGLCRIGHSPSNDDGNKKRADCQPGISCVLHSFIKLLELKNKLSSSYHTNKAFLSTCSFCCYTERMFSRIRVPRAALWLYGGSLAAGFLNYLYNVILARDAFLGPKEFGMLAALSSFLYLEGVVVTVVTTVTAAYVAGFVGRKQPAAVWSFVRHFSWQVGRVGLGLGALVAVASPWLVQWLHVPTLLPLWLLAITFPVALAAGVTLGALQGAMAFGMLSLVLVIGATFRLVLAIPLVAGARWGVSGALLAGVVAALVVYGISWLPLRRYRGTGVATTDVSPVPWRDFFRYTQRVFWAMAGLTALFSVDLILVQHYLPAEQAGLYGGLSTLGRIIYFITLPFTTLMFPMVTSRLAAGHSSRRVLLLTGGALLALTLGIIAVYALAPGLVIRFTLGQSYLNGAAYLWWFAVFFGLVSLATWLVHALLAHQQAGIALLPPLALVLQLLLIARFHGSLVEIMGSSVMAAAVLVTGLSLSMLLKR